MNNYKNKTGFTLIELLVVIAIIGILSTLAVVALGVTRVKTRDTRRITDLKQISTALELYFNDQGYYPTIITPGGSIVSPDGNTTYMAVIPHNPSPNNDGNCPTNSDYQYAGNAKYYNLSTCIGENINNLGPGIIFGQNGSALSCGAAIVTDIDGNTYHTLAIGTQCWLKENINTGNMISSGINQADAGDGIFEKFCMNNDESNCSIYGGLYQWHTAMALAQRCDEQKIDCSGTLQNQGICPPGWSIPTYYDSGGLAQKNDTGWSYFKDYLSQDGNGGSGSGISDIGGKIKEAGLEHWNRENCDDKISPAAICNSTGFSALGAGFIRDFSEFLDLTYSTYWWSKDQETDNTSYAEKINSEDSSFVDEETKKYYGMSVRCVMGSQFKPN